MRQWARRGTRPTQPADQRYDNAYLFGAICPARGVGAALALPYADTDMMQLDASNNRMLARLDEWSAQAWLRQVRDDLPGSAVGMAEICGGVLALSVMQLRISSSARRTGGCCRPDWPCRFSPWRALCRSCAP